jgi:hypothetical protein
MGLPIATDACQMHGVLDSAHAPVLNVVAGFIRALEYAKTLPTILEHFRHEGHIVQHTFIVEGGQYFLLTAHLDELSGNELELLGSQSSHF